MFQHPEYFEKPGNIREIKSHDLVELCQKASILLGDQEKSILTRLTAYVNWIGRYRVPLREKDWATRRDSIRVDKEHELIEQLYAKIWAESESVEQSVT